MRHSDLADLYGDGPPLRPDCPGSLVPCGGGHPGFAVDYACDACGDRVLVSALDGQVLRVESSSGEFYWLACRHRALPEPEAVESPRMPFSPEETLRDRFLRAYGFCPRCRRAVYVHPDGTVRDVCPRDRPQVYRTLCAIFSAGTPRRDVFGLRLRWGHDCSAPVVPDPEAAPRDRFHEVYDTP